MGRPHLLLLTAMRVNAMLRYLLSLVVVLGITLHPAIVEAKGGPKGKGGGGSAFKSGGKSGGQRGVSRTGSRSGTGPSKSDRTFGGERGQSSAKSLDNHPSSTRLSGRDHARSVQRLNEERKLTHRQQTAQKLREIGERNGNDNLLRTADKMDQQALDHYDKRMNKIDGITSQEGTSEVANLTESSLGEQPFSGETASQLQDVARLDSQLPDGFSPSSAGRLAQEEWKLQHQLDVAQRLRDNAARNGNENLLRAAERMETMAAQRYQTQLEKLGLFSTPEQLLAPTSALPVPGI